MGRKADPRGKDRPRSIVLAGDVAEIAQSLADKGVLSATLSELLRFNYGFGDAIEEKKRELASLHADKMAISDRETIVEEEIEALESRAIEEAITIRPALERKIEILAARHDKLGMELAKAFDPQTRSAKLRQHEEVWLLLSAAKKELKELN